MKSVSKNTLTKPKGGATAQTRPAVNFPMQDETVASSDYTIRVAAPDTTPIVDVSIDQGPWLACRKAEGFWWFDWSGYDNGNHEVIARIPGKNGRWLMSTPNEFTVERTY